MNDDKSAAQTAKAVSVLLANGKKDPDVQALGVESFLSGIAFNASTSEVTMTINYDQATFDQLIALVTQLVKSMPGQPPAKATPTTDTEAPKAQDNANHAANPKPAKRPTRVGNPNADAKKAPTGTKTENAQ